MGWGLWGRINGNVRDGGGDGFPCEASTSLDGVQRYAGYVYVYVHEHVHEDDAFWALETKSYRRHPLPSARNT